MQAGLDHDVSAVAREPFDTFFFASMRSCGMSPDHAWWHGHAEVLATWCSS